MTDLHAALAKAMTTHQVEERLKMRDGELLRFLSAHAELSPPKFGNRYVWTQEHVRAVEEFIDGIKSGTICASCGQPVPPLQKQEGGGDARD